MRERGSGHVAAILQTSSDGVSVRSPSEAAERKTHRTRFQFADDADEAADVVNLASGVVDPFLHRALLERTCDRALVLVHALGAVAQRFRHGLRREPAEREARRTRSSVRRSGRSRARRRGGGPDESQDLFEHVVGKDIVDESVTRQDDNVVLADLDRKLLRILGRRVFGVRARLERVIEPVLLLLGPEDVLVAADHAARAIAEVG